MKTHHRFMGVALASAIPFTASPLTAADLFAPPRLSWEGSDIALRWSADPNVLLQRTRSLERAAWENVAESLGQGEHREAAGGPAYYRLARLSADDPYVKATRWENEISSLIAERIHAATLPPSARVRPGETSKGDNATKSPPGDLPPYTWATQPGLIRSFGSSAGFMEAWPLYSSSREVLTSTQDLRAEQEKLADWESQPERFTDLNEPIGEGDGRVFPVLDPRAATTDKAEGFSFASGGDRLPMPVEWLYVLKDGTRVSASPDGRVPGATRENPITARLAYWTDDETCKINVNTASEGIPWDTPRCDTPVERGYAMLQPVTHEAQRYPGHPATTCLSALLYPGQFADTADSALTPGVLADIFRLTPRINDGGTSGGTARGTEPISFDADPLYDSPESWTNRAGMRHVGGLITARSSAPEVTAHGRPRINVWPIHEMDSPATRSEHDGLSARRSTLGSAKYFFQRADSGSRHGEFYTRANRGNVNLFRFLMSQVYRPAPGTSESLAKKYGATLREFDYSHETEYKLDHVNIALQMFDYIRATNLLDGTIQKPYLSFEDSGNHGQVPGINLIGRNLAADDGSGQQAENWMRPSLEPKGMGRIFTISEVALVMYSTATARITAWNDGNPKFGPRQGGAPGDAAVVEEILRNKHKRYAEWIGRRFGPEDVGKAFHFVEVGLLPEIFCPAQGYPMIHPRISMRLMTGGRGYLGGVGGVNDDETLKLNGVPLELWGDSFDSRDRDQLGPVLMTADASQQDIRADLPKGQFGAGGYGGYRACRFGEFTVQNGTMGFQGINFLANGSGPLSQLYCQTPVIVREDERITLTQGAPMQLLVYDTTPESSRLGLNNGNLSQVFHLRWAMPGERLTFDRPNPTGGDYAGWTRRMDRAAAANSNKGPVSAFEGKLNTELVKSVLVCHGDYRHVAGRRHVPSELMQIHPKVRDQRLAHGMTMDHHPGYTSPKAAPGIALADDLHGRNLVKGVQYDPNNRPDLVGNPENRARFSPLMSPAYKLPIDPSITRDFDNGTGPVPDGPFSNKPDEGADDIDSQNDFRRIPYFATQWNNDSYVDRNLANSFPHRQVSSPVCFGSLPSALQANAPWTCLLFRPNVSTEPHLGEAGRGLHYDGDRKTLDGFSVPQLSSVERAGLPADHFWLDLFWMPNAAPDLSPGPFATAGKVNLNFEMFPFRHIHRATALHAVLKSERLLCIPTSAGPSYKTKQGNPNWRRRIDAAETLKAFEDKFQRGEIFRAESEICEHFLIPEGEKWDAEGKAMRAFWDRHRLSGDNVLEKPYANIHARVTTKSNAFAIHYRVQTIRKSPEAPPDRFTPNQDAIADDFRGRLILERQLEAAKAPNYLRDLRHEEPRLEAFYAYRVAARRRW